MLLDDGRERREMVLDRPDLGLIIGPMVWREMHDFTPDCVMLVLTDDYYNEADYIRSIDEFRSMAARG